jgi:DNA gyrase subunit A
VKEFVPDRYIVMVTKHGVIKKCELTEFDNPMSRGIIALGLDEGDELMPPADSTGRTSSSWVARRAWPSGSTSRSARHGRPARGVRAMELDEGDYLVGVEVVEEDGLILTISENGFGKRTLEEYRMTGRGARASST